VGFGYKTIAPVTNMSSNKFKIEALQSYYNTI